MTRALSQITAPYQEVIVDGQFNFLAHLKESRAIIKADSFIEPVMAASVIAKVARDNYMIKLARRYPGYLFENHVGYGTKEHLKQMSLLGLTKQHRRSFAPCRLISGASVG